jgi:predicted MFS family arabinose efflux permease
MEIDSARNSGGRRDLALFSMKKMNHINHGTNAQPIAADSSGMSRALALLMATSCGLLVASITYCQPLLDAMRQSLGMTMATAGLVVTVTQLGYALGLAFLVPLGDLVERRALIVWMTVAIAVCLAGMATAPFSSLLLAEAFLMGALSVVAQVLVAFAATLANPNERGRVVGTVMSGLLLGLLLARTAAGGIAQLLGWRAVYAVASVLMIGLSLVLYRGLPKYRPNPGISYLALIKSVISLFAEEPILRLRAFYGVLAFATFSALWTPLALLLSRPPFEYSTGTIGIFGLAGVAGVLAASLAGRMADRGWTRRMTGITTALLALSWIPLQTGAHSLGMLLAGIVLIDFAVNGLQIINQSEIYRLRPDARSRITSAYMASFYAGGVLGSACSSLAYAQGGWPGACLVGTGFGVVATVTWLLSLRRS